MNRQEIKDGLLKGLNNTAAENVVVEIPHVLSLITQETAEKLSHYAVETESPRFAKKNSAIPPEKRFVKTGLARFNRLQLIEAIEKEYDAPRSGNEGGLSEEPTEQQ